MAMMHNSLVAFYEKLFAFKQYHSWTVPEIEALMPWEMEVMTSLISNYMDAMEAKRKQDVVTRRSMN